MKANNLFFRPATIVILLMAGFISCDKKMTVEESSSLPEFSKTRDESALIQEFLRSDDFSTHFANNRLVNNGQEFNMKSSYVKYVQAGQKKIPVLFLALAKKDQLFGYIISCKAPDDYHNLRNNARYMMAYRDYSQYDPASKTGQTSEFDLNENYKVGTLKVEQGNVVDWQTFDNPNREQQVSDQERKPHYCDANRNYDVTWGECYTCLKGACDSDPSGECRLLCDLLGFGTYCSGAIAASCGIVAMFN